jgi:mannosyltransferase OCH1-like enzyme
MDIPKIIHQTWMSGEVPDDFARMARSWQVRHRSWQYHLWTNDMNRKYIKAHFPFFLTRFDSYGKDIQRVDAMKYFILLREGGIFIDMDIECFRDITPVIDGAKCVLGKEPQEHCQVHKKELIISTAFMAAAPGSPFMQALCAELENIDPHFDNPNDLVLETTGPFMLTRVYKRYDNKENIRLLEPDVLYPLTKSELARLTELRRPDEGMREKLQKAFAIHYYAGTWWKKDAHGMESYHFINA